LLRAEAKDSARSVQTEDRMVKKTLVLLGGELEILKKNLSPRLRYPGKMPAEHCMASADRMQDMYDSKLRIKG